LFLNERRPLRRLLFDGRTADQGSGILIALDVIPDLFKTLLNVTGHMTATVLLSRTTPT
jgi:Na+/H+-dicarboxylate symporter